jgi:hypothetical protein
MDREHHDTTARDTIGVIHQEIEAACKRMEDGTPEEFCATPRKYVS